mgnify:CR=1 FL=1
MATKWIGAHVSAAGGVENVPKNAEKIGANATALFTKNQRQWSAKPLTEENINGFKERCKEMGLDSRKILPHASYLINLGNPEKKGLEKSRNGLLDEMQRCEQLGITMLNFHPGSHKDQMEPDDCLKLIAESVNILLDKTSEVTLVLENTAGQGTSMGHDFAHLARIIELVDDKSRIGTCIDTAHAFAAGYEMNTPEGYEKTWEEFEEVVGWEYLNGMHINDSKKALGTRVDRHEKLGDGEIGWDLFRWLARDERLEEIPLILETPNKEGWKEQIEQLRKFEEED